MAEINLPFLSRFRDPMIQGRKTMTCRTIAMGMKGDTFTWFRFRFRLTNIRKVPLGIVARDYWLQEGCSSSEDFERVWAEIHPNRGFDPGQIVWAHEFERLGKVLWP